MCIGGCRVDTMMWAARSAVAAVDGVVVVAEGLTCGKDTHPAATTPSLRSRSWGVERKDKGERVDIIMVRYSVVSLQLRVGVVSTNEKDRLVVI